MNENRNSFVLLSRIRSNTRSGMNSVTTHTTTPESIIVTGTNNLPTDATGTTETAEKIGISGIVVVTLD
ncbi:unnamed protein product [Lathyrus oleraceus]